jgi:hypothetical protein
MKKSFAAILTVVMIFSSLVGCAYDGAGYPKPEYNYASKTDDPELFLESEFGTSSQFKAKIDSVQDNDDCLDTQRVAYLQQMDSYLRRADAPGPWKFAAPADKPILIAGQWTHYSSAGYDHLSKRKTVMPATSCPWAAKILTPKPGAKYRVRLFKAGPMACSLSVTSMDGAPVETKDAPNCARPPR